MSATNDDGGNTTPTPTGAITCCDRDRVNNVWVEGADDNGVGGICMLDTMTEAQVIGVLSVNETARADLLRVTSNQILLGLADTVERLSTEDEEKGIQDQINANDKPESIPFYAIFRGQPPFAQ